MPPASAGSTNVVSENPISSASACMVLAVDAAGVREDRELIAGERRVGEDVDHEVAESRHRGTLSRTPRISSPAVAHAIVVSDLTKSYGASEALRGVSFDVAEGEVFGLLGPNGAGKTTTVEILEGYRRRDGGAATVLGFDPGRGAARAPRADGRRAPAVRAEPAPDRPRDAPPLRRLLRATRATSTRSIELVGLGEKRDARVKSLSGGQKRRLDLGVALVGNPELVFLDEPTTGFDPAARRAAWELIRALRSLGTTILLTTHYLDEAQQLADRVAVLRDGEIVRQGSPADLIGDTQHDRDPLRPRRRAASSSRRPSRRAC